MPFISLSTAAETTLSQVKDRMEEGLTHNHLHQAPVNRGITPTPGEASVPASHHRVTHPRQQSGATKATAVTWNMIQGQMMLGWFGDTRVSPFAFHPVLDPRQKVLMGKWDVRSESHQCHQQLQLHSP